MQLSYISQQTGEVIKVRTGKKLGKGQYGEVFTLLDENNQELDLVCKAVEMVEGKKGFWGFRVSTRRILLEVRNELKFLRKQNLLTGYQRKENIFFIVMKKVPGEAITEKGYEEACFKALRVLHRQNIAHLDPHPGNFLLFKTPTQVTATAIDFGKVQEADYSQIARGLWAFCKIQQVSFKKLLKLFAAEMKEYALENKQKFVYEILIKGALFLSAIYGLPAVGVLHLLVGEFLNALFIYQLDKELQGEAINSFILGSFRPHQGRRWLEIAKQCLSLYLLYSQFMYHGMKLKNGLEIVEKIAVGSQWQRIFSYLDPALLLHSHLLYLSVSRLITNLTAYFDKEIAPEWWLTAKTDLCFKYPAWKKKCWPKAVTANPKIPPSLISPAPVSSPSKRRLRSP